MTRNTMTLTVALAAMLVLPALAAAETITITTADGNGADNYVRGGSHSGANYGSASLVYATYYGGGNAYSRKTYLRFDLSDLPAGWEATDVTLKMEVTRPSSSELRVFGLKDNSAGQNWVETTMNFNNAPGNNTSGAWFTSDATGKLASVPNASPAGTVLNFNSQDLTDFINTDTDGLVTLMIAQASDYVFMNMGSKEHNTAMAPTLEIDYIPEPATMGLLGIGAVGLLRRKRK